MMTMNYKMIKIKTISNQDSSYGELSFFEGEKDIPFAIKRVYFIYETQKGMHRGFHAHKQNWQLLFCPYGKIDIILDSGSERETVSLDDPSKGLLLHPGLWREMIWRQDSSVLCVVASEYYNPKEYICNYRDYLRYLHEKKQVDGLESCAGEGP